MNLNRIRINPQHGLHAISEYTMICKTCKSKKKQNQKKKNKRAHRVKSKVKKDK
jgi:hypothetical protein